MADLGAIATPVLGSEWERKTIPVLPLAVRRSAKNLRPTDSNMGGVYSGVVTAAGVPQAGVMLGLYHRVSMQLLDRAISAADGTYQFTGADLGRPKQYFVLALDPNEDSPYMYSLVHDHLTAG